MPKLPFMDRLAAAVRQRGTPAMVGLDPRRALLPGVLATEASAAPQAIADAYRTFCQEVIDVVASLVPVVKPQAAFFEELGPPGVAALADVVQHARAQGLLVILDAKRGDIGSTAEAYARGWLGEQGSAVAGDALTVHPYLGADALQPFLDVAAARQAGIFVLVKTSNPGSAMLQDVLVDDEPLYRRVAAWVEERSGESAGECGYGMVGAVAGATYPKQLAELRAAMPHSWLLVPGYGSQGGTAADVAGALDASGLGAVINNSRAILFAHRRDEYAERFGEARWQEAVEAATREMIDRLAAETPAGNLRAT